MTSLRQHSPCWRCSRCPVRLALSSAWIFSIWGSIDLLNAFYQANHAGLLPGQLGAIYVIPTLVLPLLLITHGLAFPILLQHPKNVSALQESRVWHEALGHPK